MTNMLRRTPGWITLTILTLSAVPAHLHAALAYSLTEIGSITADPNSYSQAGRINDRGQILGENWSDRKLTQFLWQAGVTRILNLSENGNTIHLADLNSAGVGVGLAQGNGQAGPALWRDGHVAYLPTPIDTTEHLRCATGINDLGEAIGYAYADYDFRKCYGLLWRSDVFIDLSNLGGTTTMPVDINDRSQIVGYATTADGGEHSFFWQNGTITDISHPNAASTAVNDINDRGQCVGTWRDSEGLFKAFLWQDGRMIDLPLLPGDVCSYGCGINELGQIVGISGGEHGNHLVIWDNQRITNLTNLIEGASGWDFCLPSGINSNGWISGTARAANHDRGFLLRPIPEPHSLITLCLLTLPLLLRRRGR